MDNNVSRHEAGEAELFEGVRLGRYQLRRELGRGFSSVVYEALDTQRGRLVALKVLTFLQSLSEERREDLSERFAREARAISALSHPGIVAIYEVGRAGEGREFIAMEALEGETLRARLQRDETLPPEEAVPIALQIADALQYAHERGVIHRDVKPDNVFLLPDGRVKLMDFGVAHVLSDESLTQAGMVVGSPAYMSPEQISDETLDGRSDVFSLGVTLAEMLQGHKPFEADNIPAVMNNILNRPPELEGLSPRPLRRIVEKALAKNRLHRFVSAAAFAEALRIQVVPDLPVWEPTSTLVMPVPGLPPAYRSPMTSHTSGWGWNFPRKPANRPALQWGVAALAAALLAAMYFWTTTTGKPQAQADPSRAVASTPLPVTAADVRRIPVSWRRVAKAPAHHALGVARERPTRKRFEGLPADNIRIVERVPTKPAVPAVVSMSRRPAAPAVPAPPAVPRVPQMAARVPKYHPVLTLAHSPRPKTVVRVAAARQERILTPDEAVPPTDPDEEQASPSDTDRIPDGGPVLLRRAALLYPNWVPESSLHGTVTLRVTLDADGDVTDATVERSSGSDTLDQAAIQTVQDYQYLPAVLGGQPQPSVIMQRITYP